MKLSLIGALVFLSLALSACVVEPYDGRGYHEHHYDEHDYGRRVWRE